MVQGFCFALLQCSPYKRLQRVLFCSCSYTAHTAKRHTWLYRRFSCDFPYSTARDTRPTQAAIIPPATRWSTSQRRRTSSAYQIPPPRRTLYRPAQTAYYNKVYKSASLLWINARRCSISQTMPAQRLTVWHPPPGGAVQQQGRGGRRGTIGGYRRISFRAFAR